MLSFNNSTGVTVKDCNFKQDKTVDPEVIAVLKEISKGYTKMLDILRENMDTQKPAISIK
jgi:hypothetical protein